MSKVIHVFEFLVSELAEVPPVCVMFGDESFLKQRCLTVLGRQLYGDEASMVPTSMWTGNEVQWRDVSDELATSSLFAATRRSVVLRDADDFVKKYRTQLEDYVEKPSAVSTLVLDVKSWPSNTRLAKRVAKTGWTIDCRAPQRQAGKRAVVDRKRITKWIREWSSSEHGLALSSKQSDQVLELVGESLSLMDQELAKLALFADDAGGVSDETVVNVVGGWRTQTTWELLDLVCDGNAAAGLEQLDRLLQAGEHPQALFGAVAWTLRRFAAAAHFIRSAERSGRRTKVPDALVAVGFSKFPPQRLQQAEQQLRRIGRRRALLLYDWLLDADLKLKGSHSAPDRARFVLEKLILRLSTEADHHLTTAS